VDVTTGSYELDESDVAASDRALAKNPDALLRGSRLRVDVVPGGSVLVEEL
jgi:hypothetical protein